MKESKVPLKEKIRYVFIGLFCISFIVLGTLFTVTKDTVKESCTVHEDDNNRELEMETDLLMFDDEPDAWKNVVPKPSDIREINSLFKDKDIVVVSAVNGENNMEFNSDRLVVGEEHIINGKEVNISSIKEASQEEIEVVINDLAKKKAYRDIMYLKAKENRNNR